MAMLEVQMTCVPRVGVCVCVCVHLADALCIAYARQKMAVQHGSFW